MGGVTPSYAQGLGLALCSGVTLRSIAGTSQDSNHQWPICKTSALTSICLSSQTLEFVCLQRLPHLTATYKLFFLYVIPRQWGRSCRDLIVPWGWGWQAAHARGRYGLQRDQVFNASSKCVVSDQLFRTSGYQFTHGSLSPVTLRDTHSMHLKN